MKLFSLTWPIFVETVLFMTLGFVDTFMLSKYSDHAAGAIGATTQITSFIHLLFMIIAGGAAVVLAQHLGAKRYQSAQKVMGVALVMNFIMGIMLSGFLMLAGNKLLSFIRLTPDLMPHAETYIKIVGSFMFVNAINSTLSGFIRTHGRTKQSMFISILMNVLNVVGDAALIFGWFGLPVMGAKGVAIATVCSSFIAMIIFTIYSFKYIIKLRAILHVLKHSKDIIVKLLKIGIPTAVEGLSYNLSNIVLTAMLFSTLGQNSVISRIYVTKIVFIAIAFSHSIGQSTQIMIGHKVGAKNYDGAYKTGKRNFCYALLFTSIAAAFMIVFQKELVSIFTTDADIISISVKALAVFAFLEPGRAFNIVFISALRGAGDVVFPVAVCVVMGWGFRLGMGYIFGVTMGYGLAGFVFGSLLDEWFRGLIMLVRWKRRGWTKFSLTE